MYVAKLIPPRVHAKCRDLMQFRVAARESKFARKCFGIICAPLVHPCIAMQLIVPHAVPVHCVPPKTSPPPSTKYFVPPRRV